MKLKNFGTVVLIALGVSFANAGEPDQNYLCVGFDTYYAQKLDFKLMFSNWEKGKGYTSKEGLFSNGQKIDFLEQPECQEAKGRQYQFGFKKHDEIYKLNYVYGCEAELSTYSVICIEE